MNLIRSLIIFYLILSYDSIFQYNDNNNRNNDNGNDNNDNSNDNDDNYKNYDDGDDADNDDDNDYAYLCLLSPFTVFLLLSAITIISSLAVSESCTEKIIIVTENCNSRTARLISSYSTQLHLRRGNQIAYETLKLMLPNQFI